MLPGILLTFFIPALLFTDVHPVCQYHKTAKIGAINTFLPSLKDVGILTNQVIGQVQKHRITNIYNHFTVDNWLFDQSYDFQQGYCHMYSKLLVEYYTSFGFKAKVITQKDRWGRKIHSVVKVWTINGWAVVDATFRQFLPPLSPTTFQLLHIPQVLITYENIFYRVLYQFPVKPIFGREGYLRAYASVSPTENWVHGISSSYLFWRFNCRWLLSRNAYAMQAFFHD